MCINMPEVHSLSYLTPVLELNLDSPPNLIMNLGREILSRIPQLAQQKTWKVYTLENLLDGLQADNGDYNVVTALQHGLLQLLDATSKVVVNIPPNHVQSGTRFTTLAFILDTFFGNSYKFPQTFATFPPACRVSSSFSPSHPMKLILSPPLSSTHHYISCRASTRSSL